MNLAIDLVSDTLSRCCSKLSTHISSFNPHDLQRYYYSHSVFEETEAQIYLRSTFSPAGLMPSKERGVCVCVLLDLLVTCLKHRPQGQAWPWSSSGHWQSWGSGASPVVPCAWVAGTLGTGISPFGKTLPAASTLGKK